jgi:hypothetical protein
MRPVQYQEQLTKLALSFMTHFHIAGARRASIVSRQLRNRCDFGWQRGVARHPYSWRLRFCTYWLRDLSWNRLFVARYIRLDIESSQECPWHGSRFLFKFRIWTLNFTKYQ